MLITGIRCAVQMKTAGQQRQRQYGKQGGLPVEYQAPRGCSAIKTVTPLARPAPRLSGEHHDTARIVLEIQSLRPASRNGQAADERQHCPEQLTHLILINS